MSCSHKLMIVIHKIPNFSFKFRQKPFKVITHSLFQLLTGPYFILQNCRLYYWQTLETLQRFLEPSIREGYTSERAPPHSPSALVKRLLSLIAKPLFKADGPTSFEKYVTMPCIFFESKVNIIGHQIALFSINVTITY